MTHKIEYLKFEFSPTYIKFNEKMYFELKDRLKDGGNIGSKELFSKYFKIYHYHAMPIEFKSIIFGYIFVSTIALGMLFYYDDESNFLKKFNENIQLSIFILIFLGFFTGFFQSTYYYLIFISDRSQYSMDFLDIIKKSNSYDECYKALLTEWKKQ